MSEDQGFGLLWAVGGLVLVGSSLVARRLPLGQTLKMSLGWLAIFGALFVLFALRDDFAGIWNRVKLAAFGQQAEATGGALRVAMAEDGHFWADGAINGQPVRFLIDSGATVTALSRATAEATGVSIDDSGFPVLVETANGTVEARRGRIATLTIGPITRSDFAATVSPELGDMNLLGMNFLSTLRSWRVEGRTLVLEP